MGGLGFRGFRVSRVLRLLQSSLDTLPSQHAAIASHPSTIYKNGNGALRPDGVRHSVALQAYGSVSPKRFRTPPWELIHAIDSSKAASVPRTTHRRAKAANATTRLRCLRQISHHAPQNCRATQNEVDPASKEALWTLFLTPCNQQKYDLALRVGKR